MTFVTGLSTGLEFLTQLCLARSEAGGGGSDPERMSFVAAITVG